MVVMATKISLPLTYNGEMVYPPFQSFSIGSSDLTFWAMLDSGELSLSFDRLNFANKHFFRRNTLLSLIYTNKTKTPVLFFPMPLYVVIAANVL